MRITMIAINDPAGTAIQFTKAVNRLTGHSCRLVTLEIRYNFMFEKDLHVPFALEKGAAGRAELEQALSECDVLHFHMTADEHTPLTPDEDAPLCAAPLMQGKKIVHHHHGHPDFRGNPEKYQKKYQDLGRKNLLVSTPDLLHKLPGARWLPNLAPIHEPLFSPPDGPRAAPLRIGHSPTRKDLKNTDEFLAVCERLRARLGESAFDVDVIENTLYSECLARKQQCEIVFDHMQGYFGVSSLEALSQGTAVIAGLNAWNQEQIRAFFGCDALPWVLAYTEQELEARLEQLIREKELRREIGRISRAFMERYWNADVIAAWLDEFYTNLH